MKQLSLAIALLFLSTFLNAQTHTMVIIPADTFSMGDHFGFVDPGHPSDEIPVHSVKLDSFYISTLETSNQQFLAFLNSAIQAGTISVSNNIVYLSGDTVCYTNQYQSYYSISYNGSSFSIADFRTNHPMVGVRWKGAALYCNWLSQQNGLEECYNLSSWECDVSKNGFRLPTEAEWEYAGRGGHKNPYYKYANGNTIDITTTNIPGSGDPYETGSFPNTTPVGFYNGALRLKTDYNWPGASTSYQTGNGANGFGLYDMQGNVWEFVNDWYGNSYYGSSVYDNPTGPTEASASMMPDGKPYKGMRGGNWYNGLTDSSGVNDGHSRISNRNPSYFRGPQDPVHPWYHIGFRVARTYTGENIGINNHDENPIDNIKCLHNYPNPFSNATTISFKLVESESVYVSIYNFLGEEVSILQNNMLAPDTYYFHWDAQNFPAGVYTVKVECGNQISVKKMLLTN